MTDRELTDSEKRDTLLDFLDWLFMEADIGLVSIGEETPMGPVPTDAKLVDRYLQSLHERQED